MVIIPLSFAQRRLVLQVCLGSLTLWASIVSISAFSNSLVFGPAQYDGQWTSRTLGHVSSMQCIDEVIWPTWHSRMNSNSVRMFKKFFQ